MGTPAVDTIGHVVKAIGKNRKRVLKMEYVNPARVAHGREGDRLSHGGTFEKPATTRSILRFVQESIFLTHPDTPLNEELIMSAQSSQLDNVVSSLNNLAKEVDNAYTVLEVSDKAPTLSSAIRSTIDALMMFKTGVLQDYIAYTIAGDTRNSKFTGKATDWGKKSDWVKNPSVTGTSTKMSEVTEPDTAQAQEVVDDEDEPQLAPIAETVQPTPVTETAKKTTRKTVKRVVRRVKKTSVLSEKEAGLIRLVLYYVANEYPETCAGLSKVLNATLDMNAHTGDTRALIGAYTQDKNESERSAMEILGEEDMPVDKKSHLYACIDGMVIKHSL